MLRLFHSVGPGDAGSARHAAVIVASSGDAITGYAIDGEITHWNPAAERLYHVQAHDAVGRNMCDVLPGDWAADVAKVLERVARGERIDNYETSRPRPDGTHVQVALTIAPMVDQCDRVVGASVAARDITQRKWAESLLNNEARVLEMIAAGARLPDSLDALAHLVEAHATRVRCSVLLLSEDSPPQLRHGGGLRLAGLEDTPADELFAHVPGGPWAQAAAIAADLVTDPRWSPCRDTVLSLGIRRCWSTPVMAAGAERVLGLVILYCHEGHCPGEEDWKLVDRVASVAALAIGRHGALEELAHRAIHDPLTGAANRTLVADRLGHVLQRLKRDRTQAAVLYLDLDRFKALNDRYGHEAGDSVLVDLTDRLQSVVRPGDTVGRLGGDEFVVLCDPIADELEAVGVADRIAQAVAEPFVVEDTEVHLTASIGIAFPREGDTAETVLDSADAAMYQAKGRGKARFQVFDTAMHEEALARLHTEQSLREALDQDQFTLVYQPLVDLDGERCVGVEALLRWDHPQRGVLAPGEFLDIAEERGLIVPIGNWALGEACRQAARWHQQTLTRELKVHVNISAPQLRSRLPRSPPPLLQIRARTRPKSVSRSPRRFSWPTRRSPCGCFAPSSPWGCCLASTTSGSATPPSATSTPSPSTSSRSIARSFMAFAAGTRRQSFSLWWALPTPWTSKSWPRVWRPSIRSSDCARWGATSARASSGARPVVPNDVAFLDLSQRGRGRQRADVDGFVHPARRALRREDASESAE